MFAASLIGPENLREYSTNDEMSPSEMPPARYSSAPKMLISVSDRLLMKLTDGPVTLA